MHIAIQASDLDARRIDGTRVYIYQLLKRFGTIVPDDLFSLYHRSRFNAELQPPDLPNYRFHAIRFPCAWTQTRFAFELFRIRPDRIWMPIHSVPIIRRRGAETIVTIHDLAFLFFPDHFPFLDRVKLRFFTDWAVRKSDRIIAISRNTQEDILRLYPEIAPEKIRVIHHGFDREFFQKTVADEETERFLKKIGTKKGKYILYVGALQPRKNISALIRAFDKLKQSESFGDIKLVLAGEKAWLWEEIFETARLSPHREDIVFPGRLSFSEVRTVFQNCAVFAYPSLYEGFGLPVLEGFASDVPVVCSGNSSLPEAGGDAAVYFDAKDDNALFHALEKLLTSPELREQHVRLGREQLQKFSWDTCARETLDWIHGI